MRMHCEVPRLLGAEHCLQNIVVVVANCRQLTRPVPAINQYPFLRRSLLQDQRRGLRSGAVSPWKALVELERLRSCPLKHTQKVDCLLRQVAAVFSCSSRDRTFLKRQRRVEETARRSLHLHCHRTALVESNIVDNNDYG